jgi:hypothetical protein
MSSDEEGAPVCRPASGELAVLAVACRPDWDESSVRAVLVSAQQAGVRWDTALRTMAGLLTERGTRPGDLLRALVPDWRRREAGVSREQNAGHAAAARAACGFPERA